MLLLLKSAAWLAKLQSLVFWCWHQIRVSWHVFCFISARMVLGSPILENLYYSWTTIFLYADYIFLNISLSYPHTIVVYSVHSDQTQIKGWLKHVKQRTHIGLWHTHIPIIVPMVRSLFPYTYPLNPTNVYPHTSLSDCLDGMFISKTHAIVVKHIHTDPILMGIPKSKWHIGGIVRNRFPLFYKLL